MSEPIVVEFEHVSKAFGDRTVLDDVSFQIGDRTQVACVAVSANPDGRAARQTFGNFRCFDPIVELMGTATHEGVS